jgi:predicted metalloprotease with PDZ domain
VIVDAVPGNYDISKLVSGVRRIVSAEASWMDEVPFDAYLFIYHFPRESGGGGMEHANGTAIDLDSHTLASTPHAIESVTAHEFFHLWNVKRIRPRSLDPIDYSKENYTDALWFSEGVTSTVENYALLRAGLLSEHDFYTHLAGAIAELENRPAHLTQSAGESSIDAWLEKYAYYRTPSRSISYYNKGEVLGLLIDLKLRDVSGGTKSLRELFRFMNQTYARAAMPFPDSDGVRQALESICPSDWKSFFDKYVAGTEEIPWNDFLSSVGLRSTSEPVETADAEFTAARNFDSPIMVTSVAADGSAARAGLAVGDTILQINGHPPKNNFDDEVQTLHGGDKIKLRVTNQSGERELSWKIGTRTSMNFNISEQSFPTPQQKTRREAWLKGESEPPAPPHP